MKIRVVYWLLLLACPLVLGSCSAARLKKADKYYNAGGYSKAINPYKKTVKRLDKRHNGEISFRLGECYRTLGSYPLAIATYERAVRNKYATPIVYRNLADVYLAEQRYDKALNALDEYDKRAGGDPQSTVLRMSVKMAQESAKVMNGYKVTNAGSLVNSRFSDYAPMFAADDYEKIYYTSSRRSGKGRTRVNEVTGQKPTDIYSFSIDRAKKAFTRPEPIDNAVNVGSSEEGAGCFDPSYSTFYYTQCRRSREEKFGCSIFSITVNGENWGQPQNLNLAPDSLIAAHPSISEDGLILYFVSDMPRGFGGLDIWMVERANESASWGDPINLGPSINTSRNEMYPHIRADKTLYFASNGHIGFGGLDIFMATPTGDGLWKVENMGQPINSNYDDFSFIIERDNERGLFASRRKGGKGSDDIYTFEKNVPVIEYIYKGIVKNDQTNANVGGGEVRFVGSNGAILRKKVDANGRFEMRLNSNTDYLIVSSRKGFLNQKARVTTKGLTESKTFEETLQMTPSDKPFEIPNILYEFNSAELTSSSEYALDSVVGVLVDNPTLIVEISAHSDSRGSAEVNLELSQRRAQSVVDYLIREGIDEPRLVPKGYGKELPKVVDKATAQKYSFLKVGQKLDERFINSLKTEEQKEICYQLNRRTEFFVISDRYKPE